MPAGAIKHGHARYAGERLHLVFNNVSMQNLDQKAEETRGMLEENYLTWFGNHLVIKRISTQANFHTST